MHRAQAPVHQGPRENAQHQYQHAIDTEADRHIPWHADFPGILRYIEIHDLDDTKIINRTDDKGIQGGLFDLGLADPVKIFSNVDGGVGIVGCYTSDSQTIDVIKEIGPFPKY